MQEHTLDAYLDYTGATDEQQEQIKQAYTQISAYWPDDGEGYGQGDAAFYAAAQVILGVRDVPKTRRGLELASAAYTGATIAASIAG